MKLNSKIIVSMLCLSTMLMFCGCNRETDAPENNAQPTATVAGEEVPVGTVLDAPEKLVEEGTFFVDYSNSNLDENILAGIDSVSNPSVAYALCSDESQGKSVFEVDSNGVETWYRKNKFTSGWEKTDEAPVQEAFTVDAISLLESVGIGIEYDEPYFMGKFKKCEDDSLKPTGKAFVYEVCFDSSDKYIQKMWVDKDTGIWVQGANFDEKTNSWETFFKVNKIKVGDEWDCKLPEYK